MPRRHVIKIEGMPYNLETRGTEPDISIHTTEGQRYVGHGRTEAEALKDVENIIRKDLEKLENQRQKEIKYARRFESH